MAVVQFTCTFDYVPGDEDSERAHREAIQSFMDSAARRLAQEAARFVVGGVEVSVESGGHLLSRSILSPLVSGRE